MGHRQRGLTHGYARFVPAWAKRLSPRADAAAFPSHLVGLSDYRGLRVVILRTRLPLEVGLYPALGDPIGGGGPSLRSQAPRSPSRPSKISPGDFFHCLRLLLAVPMYSVDTTALCAHRVTRVSELKVAAPQQNRRPLTPAMPRGIVSFGCRVVGAAIGIGNRHRRQC